MIIIGITGKSGSGKSMFAKYLAKSLNCSYINIDKIGHEATYRPEMLDSFTQIFDNSILDKNGKIDRKKLGDIVFASKEKMDMLTDLTWKYMQNKLDYILEKEKNNFIILEWALLPISKYWEICDYRILTQADDNARKNKVMQRDNISEEYFYKRESSSLDYSNYNFDYIYECNYDDTDLRLSVNSFCQIIKRRK